MFSTHSEPGDLSDKFELESEGLQEKVTNSISGRWLTMTKGTLENKERNALKILLYGYK